jgi:hypothetical protein
LPESGLRQEGATADAGMKELRRETSHIRGADQRGATWAMMGNLTARVEISSAVWSRRDKHLAHTEMTDSLDAVFVRARDAAAAHDHD